MTVLQTVALPADAIQMRWQEQYVTAGLNTKNIAVQPKGVLMGFRIVPNSGYVVTVQVDPVYNMSVANVLETTGGLYSVSLVQNANINIDLTAQANTTVYVVLDVQYIIGTNTQAQVKVVDVAELSSNLDLIVLAKIAVPNVGPVTTTNINMGYRQAAGDLAPEEAFQKLNLVSNSGFESDIPGNAPGAWTNSGFDTCVVDGTISRSGTNSLKLIKTVAGTPFVQSALVGATPGRRYKVGAWIRSATGDPITSGNGAKVQVVWFDSTGTLIGTAVTAETALSGGGTTFTSKLGELIAPATAATAALRIFFDGCSGTLYVDDAQFITYFNEALIQSLNFLGGPSWFDGTTNPATSINDQFKKIISDLAGTGGAAKVGFAGSGVWADGSTNPSTSIENQLDKIVLDLSAHTGAGGAAKIGFTPAGNLSSTRIDTALAELDTEKAGLALTNTFSAANTFSAGITISGAVGLALSGTGDVTFATIAQKVAWPSSYISERVANNLSISNVNAVGYASFFSSGTSSQMALFAPSGLSSTQALFANVDSVSGGVSFLNPYAGYIDFGTTATSRWRILATGEFQAQGASRAIQSVLDPVTAQDAATLHSQTTADEYGPPRNYVLNSSMTIWQRGVAPLALTSSGYNFLADRWYSLLASGSGTHTQNGQFLFFSVVPFNYIARDNGTDTNVSKRSLVYEVEYEHVGYLANMNGNSNIPLTLQFSMLNGTGITGTLVCKLYNGQGGCFAPSTGGYATQSVAFTSGSLIAGGTFQYLIPGGSMFGSTTRLAIAFEWTPSANPAVPNESFGIKDVMLFVGDRTSVGAFPAPVFATGAEGLERLACQRYYEKSYNYADPAGTSTVTGRQMLVHAPTSTLNTLAYNGLSVKYKTPKPGPGVVTLWSESGTVGQWTTNGTTGQAVAPVHTSEKGFEVANNTGGTVTPTAAALASGHWEVSCEVGQF